MFRFARAELSRWLAILLGAAALLEALATGENGAPANLAAFGRIRLLGEGNATGSTDLGALASETNASVVTIRPGQALLVEWDQPRAIQTVDLHFDGPPPATDALTMEWWRRIWPDNGTGGWMKLDDPFNGAWTRVKASATTQQNRVRFQFAPLETAEAPGIVRTGMTHRVTYKLKISPLEPVRIRRLDTFSDSVWRQAGVRFEWGVKTTTPGNWSPTFEARNGRVLGVRPAGRNAAVVEVAYADNAERLSADRGYLVLRSGEMRSFAVFVDDVLREGGLLVRDVGVFVSDAAQGFTSARWPGPTGDVWSDGTVATQVARLPEQTLAQARQSMPAKPPRYIFLGVPNLRQEIAVWPGGEIELRADALRSPGYDSALRPWTWENLIYDFATGPKPVMGRKKPYAVDRSMEDGWLPVACHRWQDGDVEWTETCVAAPLDGDIAALASTNGTETVVLATRFAFRNTALEPRTAWLWLELNHSQPLRLTVDDLLVLSRPSVGEERPGLVPVRGRFNRSARGDLSLAVLQPATPGSHNPSLQQGTPAREAVRYRVDLASGETGAVEFFLPYVELLDARELGRLKALTFETLHRSVTNFWYERTSAGMTLEVPERQMNDLFRANLWHVLISTDLDPATGFHQHGAATHEYKNFLNETAMVARSLEMRGEHDEALHLLEPFLVSQGTKGLPGNFRSREGVLYAAHPSDPDPYTAQGYNLHHGWGLWAAAEHYRWTRDASYLQRAAPGLVAAANWITKERQATRFTYPGGSRPAEFGLLPAGDLEDVEEYLYYYATDAYHHLGLDQAADVLGEAFQAAPESIDATTREEWRQTAIRLRRDADAFAADIRASVAESVATTPVVRLRDGSYVPYVPPRVWALTHRQEGWIREGLYPALHLVNGRLYDPTHPFVNWMIEELEDNIFLSTESGYAVADPRADFFSHGGFTLQPNLLDLALVYLQRDQIPNCLRAFYNTGSASIYPEVACIAEWMPVLGQGAGPLFKTPDECKFVQWLRQLLVLERGDALELGLGVPRGWMEDGKRVRVARAATWFGNVDLEINSHAAAGRITAEVILSPGTLPQAVRLRLRHPEGLPIRDAIVNGRPAKVNSKRQVIDLPARAGRWRVEAGF